MKGEKLNTLAVFPFIFVPNIANLSWVMVPSSSWRRVNPSFPSYSILILSKSAQQCDSNVVWHTIYAFSISHAGGLWASLLSLLVSLQFIADFRSAWEISHAPRPPVLSCFRYATYLSESRVLQASGVIFKLFSNIPQLALAWVHAKYLQIHWTFIIPCDCRWSSSQK